MPHYAHTGLQSDQSDWHKLSDHLRVVATLARQLATASCPKDTALAEAAYAAGMLHDLGKFRPGFMLKLEFEFRNEQVPVPRDKTFHKQAGAAKAAFAGHAPVAFAIAGHHGGMPDKHPLEQMVQGLGGQAVVESIWPSAIAELPELRKLSLSRPPLRNNLHGDLFTRLLFSCLVDADWADTAAHERQIHGLPPEPPPAAIDGHLWLERVLSYIVGRAASCKDRTLLETRMDVLHACLDAAERPPGLFTLTVPTGGAKTLSSLAFALKHAARHELRRVIYVAPYLSILDQNAEVIRDALGFDRDACEVLEHHSLAEPPGDANQDDTAREAAARRAENWDAPIVITTSVQFFESLFSNMPSRCRKLHNIARSVVVLDECQTLPPQLVGATCGMLKQLAEQMRTTLVFCTATQPAFDHEDLEEHQRLHAHEIIPPGLDLFQRLKRVQLSWPAGETDALSWSQVADQMLAFSRPDRPASLCIVNTRRAARELFNELKRRTDEGVFHLSTSMCAAHRLEMLQRVRDRLSQALPCYLISTQLIEAGVDVDFPVVMRELAPLESVIQAAGRCNREGLLNSADGTAGGRVIVFRSQASLDEPKKYFPPDVWYGRGRSTLETNFLNAGHPPRIDVADDIRDYYMRLYRSGDLDPTGIAQHREKLEFETVAEKYRLIKTDAVPVVIATWDEHRVPVETLLNKVRRDPSRENFRKLGPYQVNLRRDELSRAGSVVAQLDPRLDLLVWYGPYGSDIGMSADATDMLLVV